VSPSEFGFLAFGLALGIAAGVALLAMVRSHSPLRPVVRVTVTPNAIAPRDPTLAGRPRTARFGEPAPGSPDEDARLDLAEGLPIGTADAEAIEPPPAPEIRTSVPSGSPASLPAGAVGIPIEVAPVPARGPLASGGPSVAVAERLSTATAVLAGIELAHRVDVGASPNGVAVHPRPPVARPMPGLAADPIAIPIVAGRTNAGGRAKAPVPTAGDAVSSTDPCAGDRERATSACTAADAARDAARAVADRLRESKRAHADLQARVEEAGALADPRRLAAEKERLHAQFTEAHGVAASPDEAEEAAREWLTEVSALNTVARDAARRVQDGTEELREHVWAIERLELEANTARISAERAEDACRAAREQLAACEERERPVSSPGSGQEPTIAPWPGGPEAAFDRRSAGRGDAERMPIILRILRGDADARARLVASLAAGDASATTAWDLRIAAFVDAVVFRAIEDGFLEVSEEDAFWRLFSGEEQREIVLALSALGFRYDGLGGFADDRTPSARDLSLAVGYAGLDRMRIRSWPGDAALAELFDGTRVRSDLWLATQADDLSLGRVEAALGSRAAALHELWDAWGIARPAMLEEA
jgi:hypothetical protein